MEVAATISRSEAVSAQSLIPPDRDRVALSSGAVLQRLPVVDEPRGMLVFAEIARHLSFAPKRFFAVYAVPKGEVRGCHAHHEGHEFLISLRGTWNFLLDDARTRQTIALDTSNVGLHIPPRVWRSFYPDDADAVLASLSSETYSAADYIRDYEAFARMMRGRG
jgi:UDP-2-acetamido-3-amino-2,3-dideoxy-glucuronate N-acetyltransferase